MVIHDRISALGESPTDTGPLLLGFPGSPGYGKGMPFAWHEGLRAGTVSDDPDQWCVMPDWKDGAVQFTREVFGRPA